MESQENKKSKVYVDVSVRTIFLITLFGFGVYFLFQLTNIILILLTSIVIASFVEHIVKRLEKHNIPRPVTVLGLYVLGIAILTLISLYVIPIIIKEVSSLVDFVSQIFQKTTFLQNIPLDTFEDTKDFFTQISGQTSSNEFIRTTQIFLGKLSSSLGNTLGGIFGGVVNVVMVAVISFYLSIQEKGIENFLRIVTPLKYESYVLSLWKRTERKIALWVKGQMLLGLVIGTILFIGLSLIGVKYALILALVAAIAELIPYGLLLAFFPAIAIAFAEGSLRLAGSTLLLYLVVQQLENYVIAPLITKKTTGISPLVVILALFIGGTLAGFWGILLAIPVSVLLIEYLTDIEQEKAVYLQNHQKTDF